MITVPTHSATLTTFYGPGSERTWRFVTRPTTTDYFIHFMLKATYDIAAIDYSLDHHWVPR